MLENIIKDSSQYLYKTTHNIMVLKRKQQTEIEIYTQTFFLWGDALKKVVTILNGSMQQIINIVY